jgi:hypothetical protein
VNGGRSPTHDEAWLNAPGRNYYRRPLRRDARLVRRYAAFRPFKAEPAIEAHAPPRFMRRAAFFATLRDVAIQRYS